MVGFSIGGYSYLGFFFFVYMVCLRIKEDCENVLDMVFFSLYIQSGFRMIDQKFALIGTCKSVNYKRATKNKLQTGSSNVLNTRTVYYSIKDK